MHDFEYIAAENDSVPDISVVIPALNERRHICGCVKVVANLMAEHGLCAEIIVVDDGSDDGTADQAREAGVSHLCPVRVIRHSHPRGKGSALASGFAISRGKLVAFIDADLEYPAETLLTMADLLGHTKDMCAIAIRVQDERPWFEQASSRVARKVTTMSLQLPVHDTQAGVKMFPGWFARQHLVAPHEHGWLYDIEALVTAQEQALKIVEVPVIQHSVRARRARLGSMIACTPAFLSIIAKHWNKNVKKTLEAHREMIKFAMVGGLNTVVDIAAYWALVTFWPPAHSGIQAAGESLAAWSMVSVMAYFMHSRFTFRKKLPLIGFYLVTALGVLVQMVLSGMGTELSGNAGALWGKGAGVILSMGITYTGYHILAHGFHKNRGGRHIDSPEELVAGVSSGPMALRDSEMKSC